MKYINSILRQRTFYPNSRHSLLVKSIVYMVCGTLLLVTVVGCDIYPQPPASQRVLNVGMILGSGGLGDRSFNDSAYEGFQEAQRQFGTRFQVVSRTSDEADLKELNSLIQQEYDLLIGIGFENAGYIETLAKEHPDRKFAVVDAVVDGDNVASIVYREQEGDFLMGVLAAKLTQSNGSASSVAWISPSSGVSKADSSRASLIKTATSRSCPIWLVPSPIRRLGSPWL